MTKSWVSLDTHPHPDPSPLLTASDVVEDQETHKVVLALGSNLGDSCQNIEHALRLLEESSRFFTDNPTSPHVVVVDTSFMYQTAPMYVTDQPSFFNCACIVESNIRPLALLKFLKHIEDKVGRVPSIRNGPRAVDLDIVFYDDFVLDTRPPTQRAGLDNLHGELVVPHPRSYEREFVLRPLCDMVPDFVHPTLNKTISDLLRDLPGIDPSMKRVVPFPKCPTSPGSLPVTSTHWIYDAQPNQRTSPRKTHIMATLNVTPDSFSDGSDHVETTAAMAYIESSVASGASIVDIGGYSTRPGASFISIEEEISRVLPAVRAIRQHDNPRVRDILISVDTFRPEVAEAAINAGASCINDVYAFTGPDSYPYNGPNDCMLAMKGVTRKLAVPVILMHSRGDAGKNKDYSEFSYAKGNEADSQEEQVLEGVKVELGRKVDDCVKGQGGLRRWMVIVDPGIGFSKTLEGNLELLRNTNRVTTDVTIGDKSTTTRNPLFGYPTLIGASRKSFLGVILSQGENGRETIPKERNWATAAAVAYAVQQGALIVRVHDTSEMADVVAVASRICPQPQDNMGKVHGSLARAGKVKSQTPKVEKQEKKKTPKGRAKKRILYNRRFVNVTTLPGGKRRMNPNPEK
ncbi:hypothetical protein ONZ45_g7393 [Pleurotus djamor]|nr:hypothetical protein ONZ45_g7393 [Pleurotus djamor]